MPSVQQCRAARTAAATSARRFLVSALLVVSRQAASGVWPIQPVAAVFNVVVVTSSRIMGYRPREVDCSDATACHWQSGRLTEGWWCLATEGANGACYAASMLALGAYWFSEGLHNMIRHGTVTGCVGFWSLVIDVAASHHGTSCGRTWTRVTDLLPASARVCCNL
jgi:hypothetical protein